MVKETKYYDLLEVPVDASHSELTKAYGKKVLELYRDSEGDPERLKEITHAFEVLSNSENRRVYDARGEAGLSAGDPQDPFNHFYGRGGGRRNQVRKTKDLVHRIYVSLEDLYCGKTTKLALTRNVLCPKCGGHGDKEGAVRVCSGCNGRGIKVVLRQMGSMIQQVQPSCDECSGTGEVINPKVQCDSCKGKKVITEKKTLQAHVDKGMKGGQTIVFRGESNQSPNTEPGDVVIVIEEKPHERFKRQGNNLTTELEIDLLTALGGGSGVAIKHLDDRALIIKFVPGAVVKSGTVKVIRGQGMPSEQHHKAGDLHVKFIVKFPDSIEPFKVPLLELALPHNPLPQFPEDVQLEEVKLDESDTCSSADDEPQTRCPNQ